MLTNAQAALFAAIQSLEVCYLDQVLGRADRYLEFLNENSPEDVGGLVNQLFGTPGPRVGPV